jgi:hypothetical protein
VDWGPTWTPIERQTPRRITARDVNYDFIADGYRLWDYPRRRTKIIASGFLKPFFVAILDASLNDV